MTDQLALDLEPLVVPEHTPDATIQERFEAFDRANPWIRQALVRLALDLRSSGRRRIGMKALVEVVRWQYDLRTDGEPFRINNSYTSRYARSIAASVPGLEDVFETRELRAA